MSIFVRRPKVKSRIIAYYLGKLQDIHIVQKLTFDDSIIIAIVIHDRRLEILPRVGVPVDRSGLAYVVPMTGICLHHLEYAEQEMAKGNITLRPKPKPKKQYLKKPPKPLSPESLQAIELLRKGVRVADISIETGLTVNRIYVLRRKFMG